MDIYLNCEVVFSIVYGWIGGCVYDTRPPFYFFWLMFRLERFVGMEGISVS